MKNRRLSRAIRHTLWGSFAVAAVFVQQANAGSELIPSTDVTTRYDVVGWFRSVLKPTSVGVAATDFNAIEPAAGHGGEATETPSKEGHGAASEGGEGGHGAASEAEESGEGGHGPKATGSSEGKKSFTGKVVGAPPPLPKVMIGGKPVISKAAEIAKQVKESTPESLSSSMMQELAARRFKVTSYVHSPKEYLHAVAPPTNVGPGGLVHVAKEPQSPIEVIEFIDLSCGSCMADVAKIDAALQDISSTIRHTHVHAPMNNFQDTNMPAFYGKVAARAGVFWPYRASLVQHMPADANAFFDELVKSGVSVADARALMLNEARRFYRELDADAILARSLGISKPPVVYVNGIRVGEHGIPINNLSDVLKYVDARIQRGLPEPPK